MKFREGSALMRELELEVSPTDLVQPINVPPGYVLCFVCNKPTPKITSTTGAALVEDERSGKKEVEVLKTERIVGPYDDPSLPGWQTFEKKQKHFSRDITTCPRCCLEVGKIKFPPMRG